MKNALSWLSWFLFLCWNCAGASHTFKSFVLLLLLLGNNHIHCAFISSDSDLRLKANTAWRHIYSYIKHSLAHFKLLSNPPGVNFWNPRHSLLLSDSSAWGIFETHFTTQTIWYLWCNVNAAAHKTDVVIICSFHCFVALGEPRSRRPDPECQLMTGQSEKSSESVTSDRERWWISGELKIHNTVSCRRSERSIDTVDAQHTYYQRYKHVALNIKVFYLESRKDLVLSRLGHKNSGLLAIIAPKAATAFVNADAGTLSKSKSTCLNTIPNLLCLLYQSRDNEFMNLSQLGHNNIHLSIIVFYNPAFCIFILYFFVFYFFIKSYNYIFFPVVQCIRICYVHSPCMHIYMFPVCRCFTLKPINCKIAMSLSNCSVTIIHVSDPCWACCLHLILVRTPITPITFAPKWLFPVIRLGISLAIN